MDANHFEEKLLEFKGSSVQISAQNIDEDHFSMVMTFSNGGKLRTEYWRIIKDKKHYLSSFDHHQIYGLPAPINAIEKAKQEIEGKNISEVKFDRETGDIIFKFTENLKLQVLNFTGYEVWEVIFPDSTAEYSNHIYRLPNS